MPPLERPAAVQKEQAATKAGKVQDGKTDKTENAETIAETVLAVTGFKEEEEKKSRTEDAEVG